MKEYQHESPWVSPRPRATSPSSLPAHPHSSEQPWQGWQALCSKAGSRASCYSLPGWSEHHLVLGSHGEDLCPSLFLPTWLKAHLEVTSSVRLVQWDFMHLKVAQGSLFCTDVLIPGPRLSVSDPNPITSFLLHSLPWVFLVFWRSGKYHFNFQEKQLCLTPETLPSIDFYYWCSFFTVSHFS